jgi:hypothetical protein
MMLWEVKPTPEEPNGVLVRYSRGGPWLKLTDHACGTDRKYMLTEEGGRVVFSMTGQMVAAHARCNPNDPTLVLLQACGITPPRWEDYDWGEEDEEVEERLQQRIERLRVALVEIATHAPGAFTANEKADRAFVALEKDHE